MCLGPRSSNQMVRSISIRSMNRRWPYTLSVRLPASGDTVPLLHEGDFVACYVCCEAEKNPAARRGSPELWPKAKGSGIHSTSKQRTSVPSQVPLRGYPVSCFRGGCRVAMGVWLESSENCLLWKHRRHHQMASIARSRLPTIDSPPAASTNWPRPATASWRRKRSAACQAA